MCGDPVRQRLCAGVTSGVCMWLSVTTCAFRRERVSCWRDSTVRADEPAGVCGRASVQM